MLEPLKCMSVQDPPVVIVSVNLKLRNEETETIRNIKYKKLKINKSSHTGLDSSVLTH